MLNGHRGDRSWDQHLVVSGEGVAGKTRANPPYEKHPPSRQHQNKAETPLSLRGRGLSMKSVTSAIGPPAADRHEAGAPRAGLAF